MACQLFSPLVDEQPVAIRRLGFFSIFVDIVFYQDTALFSDKASVLNSGISFLAPLDYLPY